MTSGYTIFFTSSIDWSKWPMKTKLEIKLCLTFVIQEALFLWIFTDRSSNIFLSLTVVEYFSLRLESYSFNILISLFCCCSFVLNSKSYFWKVFFWSLMILSWSSLSWCLRFSIFLLLNSLSSFSICSSFLYFSCWSSTFK